MVASSQVKSSENTASQGQSGNLQNTWAESAEAAHSYLRARVPYQQFLIDYVLAYHAHVGTKTAGAAPRVPQYGAVLDLGCGPGQLGILLSQRFRKVYLRDVSDKMLATARTIVGGQLDTDDMADVGLPVPPKNVDFDIAVGTATETNVPDASVDMIIIGAAAHWFDWSTDEASRRIWDEWTRVLRPGGTVIITGARISPGNPRGPLAAATRPLRHLILNVTLDSPIARYYTKEQNSIATTMYAQLPMPWGIQSKKAVSPTTQTDWPRSSRLYSHFDHPNDVSVNGVPTILSDPYPDWMPPELAHYRSTAEASGDAYETVNKRFNTITPRRAAAWFRSASGYVKYLEEHPDEKLLVGRDDDLAARLFKESCAASGLPYDQEIELHHPTAVLALMRS